MGTSDIFQVLKIARLWLVQFENLKNITRNAWVIIWFFVYMIATPQRNISRHCWSSICKLDPAKRLQHLKATDCNNVKRIWSACTKTRNNETKWPKWNHRNEQNERNGRIETTETSKITSKYMKKLKNYGLDLCHVTMVAWSRTPEIHVCDIVTSQILAGPVKMIEQSTMSTNTSIKTWIFFTIWMVF